MTWKKPLVTTLAVLVVLYLGATFFFGTRIEQEHKRFYDELCAANPYLKCAVQEYERGFFTSQALVEWSLRLDALVPATADAEQLEENPLPEWTLRIKETIHHGPLPFANGITPVQAAFEARVVEYPEAWSEVMKQLDARLNGRVTLTGVLDADLRTGPVSFGSEVAGLELESTQTSFVVPLDFSAIRSEVRFDGMRAKDESGATFQLGALQGATDYVRGLSGLYLGDYRVYVDEVTFDGDTLVVARDISYGGAASEQDGMLTATLDMNVPEVVVGDVTYGPAVLKSVVRNLDAAKFKAFQDAMQTPQNSAMDPDAFMTQILTQSVELLRSSPELEFSEISVQTPNGTADVRLVLSFDGGQMPYAVPDPVVLLPHVRVFGDIKADESMVFFYGSGIMADQLRQEGHPTESLDERARNAVAANIEGLVNTGLVRRADEKLSIEFIYEQNRLLANDMPVPLNN